VLSWLSFFLNLFMIVTWLVSLIQRVNLL
jgi:hypothetical protein